MDNALAALEEKVRRTAEALQALRKQNAALQKEIARLKPQLEQARKKVESLEERGAAGDRPGGGRELAALREEREELARRINRLLETLEALG